ALAHEQPRFRPGFDSGTQHVVRVEDDTQTGRQEPGKPQESGKPGESEWPEGAAGPAGTWLWGEGAESSVMVVTACRVRGQ
ncbi:hypothetical protein ACFWZY_08020, partial [Streptomyces sp. NPDC058992]